MGLEECSDQEFESRIELSRKKRLRNLVFKAAAIITGTAGMYILAGYALCTRAVEIKEYAVQESIRRQPKAVIERLVAEISTPEEAAARITEDIDFSADFDTKRLSKDDYWASLQETYGLMAGDCEDGAIAFKAMLSDNPEYDVKLVKLRKSGKPGHMAAVYLDIGQSLWGFVGFNALNENGKGLIFSSAEFSSMEEAIHEYARDLPDTTRFRFDTYYIIECEDEDILYGRDLSTLSCRQSAEYRIHE
ncbi:MAG: hypothetical protein KJ955_07680 [Nanoarchaeota archaeon]|nr:hypothetical protein [Nanoarchaeota archaeon]